MDNTIGSTNFTGKDYEPYEICKDKIRFSATYLNSWCECNLMWRTRHLKL